MSADPPRDEPLLSVRDLSVRFATEGGALHALDGASFDVGSGRVVALVGESGCGKTTAASSILRILPERIATIASGSIVFRGEDLLAKDERAMRRVRGAEIAMIFQEPMTSLDPVYTIGAQIIEAIRLHRSDSRRAARTRAVELLRRVGFPEPERRVDDYPHVLSGGMRQRAMIAMALACDPALLVADEPTTALDVTVQAQILDLLRSLRDERGMSLLLVAHDLDVVASIADDLVVMYAGQVVESGPASEILRAPSHPYTEALLRSVPPRDLPQRSLRHAARRLPTIEGAVPDLRAPPPGCRFAPRCPERVAECTIDAPELLPTNGRAVRCLLRENAIALVAPGGAA